MKNNFHINVFEPAFTYDRSITVGKYPALRSFLTLTRSLSDRSDPNCPRPSQGIYYNYASHIAVLLEETGVYYCQILIDGKKAEVYEALKDADKLKKFFDEHHHNLTVLENDRMLEFPPDFDIVMTYVKGIAKARDMMSEHRALIHEYWSKLSKIEEACEDLTKNDSRDIYKQAITIAERYMIVLNAISEEIYSEALTDARRCPIDDERNHCRMFGLFVYALRIGIENNRYLRKGKHILAMAFGEMLQDMRLFMQTHPGVEEDYCNFLHLPLNDRERLKMMLASEGLTNENWGYIGGDVF